ncbi:MAG: restriction endonuclease subunit S, partial [Anaerolineales bacterium]
DDFICSSGFAVLTPQSIEPELLLVYLRLPIVCEILDLHTTASMYPAISTTDLLEIPITVPDNKEACQQIVQMVKDSRKSNQDSKHLLEIAKRGVELAIEQDERAAEAWIQEQIKQLGIKLKP